MPETKAATFVLFSLRHPPGAETSLAGVLRSLILRPHEHLLRRWNWKAALFSSLIRGALFVAANATSGWHAAAAAGAAEFVYRAATAGFYGSITQSFRRVEPQWRAMVAVSVLLPAMSHSIELALHWWRGTPNLKVSIAASICFTFLSTTFNLYAMRRGALVVGDDGAPLASDMRGMPGLIGGYLLAAPAALWRLFFARSRNRRPQP